MGIPHLLHHLQPYAERVVLQRPVPDDRVPSDSRGVIVDGPALAYHVYNICLTRRRGAQNALDAIPSYVEVGVAAVEWLRQVESFGIRIHQVFFDGLLPVSKKPVRESRLQSYANQLVNFKALHRDDLPSRSTVASGPSPSLLDVAITSPSKSLSAAPFLVVAVIEALFNSRYAPITAVVPGEADAYCAHAARNGAHTVLTSDSDLIVHDLDEGGRVWLFRDIESIHLPSRGRCLKISEYHPNAIAARLGLPNLVTAAFFLEEDNHRSLTQAVKLAKSSSPAGPDFQEFSKQYGTLPVYSSLAAIILHVPRSPLSGILARLDPRISEFVHQLKIPDKDLQRPDQRSVDMYLPFIIDDPTKTSAWRAGESIRRMTYSVLASIDPSLAEIAEYERKGTRIAATSVTVLDHTSADIAVPALLRKSQEAMERYGSLSITARWRALAAITVCEYCAENGKPGPRSAELLMLITGAGRPAMTWTFIHARAQMEAVLYSFRMLRQLSETAIALKANSSKGTRLHSMTSSLREISAVLAEMPGLTECLDHVTETDTGAQACSAIDADLRAFEQERNDDTHDQSSKKRKKKRKRQPDSKSDGCPDNRWASENVFAALQR